MRVSKKKKVGLLTVTSIAVTSGIAYAYWTADGSGTGSASTAASTQSLVVVQTSTISGMAPGDSAQVLSGKFNNPNAGPIYVGTVTASISGVTKAGGAPTGTCDATDYTLATPAMTVNAEVAPGNSVGTWSGATIKFNNKASNQDACKGATVNLTYTIS